MIYIDTIIKTTKLYNFIFILGYVIALAYVWFNM